MNDELPPPNEPRPDEPPPPADEFSPIKERSSGGTRFLEIAARGCLGVVSFVLAILAFGTIMAVNQPIGLFISAALVVALFTARKRSGPSPMLGAVVVGVAIALAISGLCTIIIMSTT